MSRQIKSREEIELDVWRRAQQSADRDAGHLLVPVPSITIHEQLTDQGVHWSLDASDLLGLEYLVAAAEEVAQIYDVEPTR